MDGFDESVMVALLPTNTDWCKLECPHMTLVYCGEIPDLKKTDFNRLAKDTSSIASLSSPVVTKVTGKAVFGDDKEKVDVFTLEKTTELLAMRNFLEDWNASEFPFNPHVTIGPTGTIVDTDPMFLRFDRIMLGWGDQYITFWLKN